MSAPARPKLKFDNVDAVITDIAHLRGNGYSKQGNWSLAQVAWHVAVPIEKYLSPPAPGATATAEQIEKKKAFFAKIMNPGGSSQFEAPPMMTPPATAGDADIERFIAALNRLKAYDHAMVEMGPLGPVPLSEFIEAQLIHSAHHLGFLSPKAMRRLGLRYATPDEVIADIRRLQQGYERAGNWSLEQNCWHLNIATRARMKPAPAAPNTPEQDARASMLATVLATGQLPSGIQSPAAAEPPAQVGSSAIDDLIEALQQLKAHQQPFAPHRLFGNMSDADTRRQILVHCSHHLGHLVPTSK
jgi:hypothetical protein